MEHKTLFRIGLLLWTLSFMAAFVDFGLTGAGDDGLVRGVNSMSKFAIWQGIAGVIAIALWIFGRRFEKGTMQRTASRLPGIILIALGIAMALFIVTAQFLTPAVASVL